MPLLTYLLSSLHAELEYIQRQIGQLFGPLKGMLTCCMTAHKTARFALKQKRLVKPEKLFADKDCTIPNSKFKWFEWDAEQEIGIDQDPLVVKEWRSWVRHVLMPTNEKMLALIEQHTDLIPAVFRRNDEEEAGVLLIPAVFNELLAHVLSYRVLISQWDEDEKSSVNNLPTQLKSHQNTAVAPFPKALNKVSYMYFVYRTRARSKSVTL